MTAEEVKQIVTQNKRAFEIASGLDDEGLKQVELFAAGVKARAEYERQKRAADHEQKAG